MLHIACVDSNYLRNSRSSATGWQQDLISLLEAHKSWTHSTLAADGQTGAKGQVYVYIFM